MPAGVKVGYGTLETIKRKLTNCKGSKNLPMFAFYIRSVTEWADEFSLPAVLEGWPPEGHMGTMWEGKGIKFLPIVMEYKCLLLTDKAVDTLTFTEKVFFSNYSKAGDLYIEVNDPDTTLGGVKYKYMVRFGDVAEYEKEGNEYEVGYQYVYNLPLVLRGIIREVDDYSVIENIQVELFINDWDAGVFNLP